MTSRNVTNIAQTGYVGKNLLATAIALSQFELLKRLSAQRSPLAMRELDDMLLALKKTVLFALRESMHARLLEKWTSSSGAS